MAHIFSAKEITAMEPQIVEMIRKLCRNLQVKSNGGVIAETDKHAVIEGVFDLRPWLNMFSYDAITSMFWSNTYGNTCGFLDKGNDMCPSMDASGKLKYIHGVDSFHSGSGFNVCLAHLPRAWYKVLQSLLRYTHGKQAAQNFSGMARYQVVQRLENPPDQPDLFSNLPVQPTERRPTPMSLSEVIAECTTMLDAGSDTTQTSLTNCMYQLASNLDKQTRLYNLLISTVTLGDRSQPIAPYLEVQKVPYLRACLDESFRCKPSVAFGLPRRTVGSGATIAGHLVPPDTTVSVPLYNVHRNESLSTHASRFIPERWLDDKDEHRNGWTTSQQEHQNLKDFVLPFSLGGRACIGRNLAYMELSIVIAALVMG